MMAEKGIVFNIQRHSIHDGPGIRTIVFLKGCPIACRWCSNPESQDFERELLYDPEKCIRCDACIEVCPEGAIRRDGSSLVFSRELCRACGLCTEVCYAEARRMEGRVMTAEEVVAEVEKDSAFFHRSGGGLTLSGGEPFAQPEFAAAVLRLAREKGLHTAVETAGHVPWEYIESALPYIDLFLFDVKHADPDRHREFTGADNRLILENLERLGRLRGADIIVRIPVVPGFNDRPDELLAIAGIAERLGFREIHFLPYHRYGAGKYRLLGKTDPVADILPDAKNGTALRKRLEALRAAVAAKGITVHIGG